MYVEHAGHSVETEAIELVLLHPEAQVTQEEAQDFVASVVEQSTIPLLVSAFATFMEVQVIGAIEHVEPIKNVLRSMAMDHVQQNNQT